MSAARERSPHESGLSKRLLKALLQKCLTRRWFVWKGPSRRRAVAITFDDGPDPAYTPVCLQVLEKYRSKATFFLIGQHAEAHPEIVRKIHRAGHAIGIHTYSHRTLAGLSYADVKHELGRTQRILREETANVVTMYRPPRGAMSMRLLCYSMLLRLRTVLWTTTFSDYKQIGTAYLLAQIAAADVHAGDILLLHDNNQYTLEALPALLDRLHNAGLECVTLPELIAVGIA